MELLFEMCTSGDTFKFNNKFYKQHKGVAMGSPLAPILANIYLKMFEEKTVLCNEFPFKFYYYYRYVDDIFVISDRSVDTNKVLTHLNSIDPNLKFKIENEKDNIINFLDITIIRQNSVIETRWFRKQSNTCRFAPWDSCQSGMYKTRLIYTMILRLSKICSSDKFYKEDIQLLKLSFLDSGYPEKVVEKHFRKALNAMNKSLYKRKINLLDSENNKNTKIVYFGIEYKSVQSDIFMVKIKQIVKHFFPNVKLIPYFTHGRNILSYFSSRYKPYDKETDRGVYTISCKNCNKIYVGETERSLRLRILEHQKYAKDPKKSAVAKHQMELGHTLDFENASVRLYEESLLKRKILECLMIKRNPVLDNNSLSFTPILFG